MRYENFFHEGIHLLLNWFWNFWPFFTSINIILTTYIRTKIWYTLRVEKII